MGNKDDVEEAAKGLLMCISNAEDFLESARSLFDEGKYRSAYLLGIYASEELGRVLLIYNYPIHRISSERWSNWRKRFHDHTEKLWFFRNLGEMERQSIPSTKTDEDTMLKNKRLDISYVGYRDDKFVAPTPVSAEEVNRFLAKIYEILQTMKKRHYSLEVVKEELKIVRTSFNRHDPKFLEAMRAELRSRGFTDSSPQ